MMKQDEPCKDDLEWLDVVRSMHRTFGGYAKKRRELIGYSQADVALMMQVDYGLPWHQTVLSKVEAGQRDVRLKEAYALANIYGIALDDLVRGEGLGQNLADARLSKPGRSMGVVYFNQNPPIDESSPFDSEIEESSDGE